MPNDKKWTVEEVHGIWWAWFPPRPLDHQFVTHATRPSNLIGPFHNEEFAKEMAAKRSKQT